MLSIGPEGSRRSAVRGDLRAPARARHSRPAVSGLKIVADRRTVGNERARQFGERRRARGAGELVQESNIASIGDRRARAHHHRTESAGATLCAPRRRNIRLRDRRAWPVAAWVAPSLRLATRAVRVAVGGGIGAAAANPGGRRLARQPRAGLEMGICPYLDNLSKGAMADPVSLFVRGRPGLEPPRAASGVTAGLFPAVYGVRASPTRNLRTGLRAACRGWPGQARP